jgi:hypothetical protein
MTRMFRRYHRQIAITLCLPLFWTLLTGVGYTIVDEWFGQGQLGAFLSQKPLLPTEAATRLRVLCVFAVDYFIPQFSNAQLPFGTWVY